MPMNLRFTGRRELQGIKCTAHVAAFDGSIKENHSCELLMINAIDGSVIDRTFGY